MFGGPSITHCLALEPDLVERGSVDVATRNVGLWDYFGRHVKELGIPLSSKSFGRGSYLQARHGSG